MASVVNAKVEFQSNGMGPMKDTAKANRYTVLQYYAASMIRSRIILIVGHRNESDINSYRV